MSRRLVTALAVALTLLFLTPAPAAVALAPGPIPDPTGVWPLTPTPAVLVGFDPPDQPWGPGHRGVDLAGAAGQVVRAALAGTVRYAGRLAGRGVVVVDHGDTRTTYEPVIADVGVGSPVAAGQPIGNLEVAGGHCLPRVCLHWGWLQGEIYLDPLDLVGLTRVRLLPLAGAPPRSPAGVLVGWTPLPLPYVGWLPLLRLLHLGPAP
ncbi:MAG: murein hydrolase activator EnvC family protein [Nocardioides sp.]